MTKCLILFAIATIVSGCASCPPHNEFRAPVRPIFYEYTDAEFLALPKSIRTAISTDNLLTLQYMNIVESRAENHNGTSQ